MKKIVLSLILLGYAYAAQSQVFSNKEVGKRNQGVIDSLKSSEYPYTLPILGKKAAKAGYTLPLSAGFSAQYIWQESELTIDNLQVGFNNSELVNLDGIISFNKAIAKSNGINVRPDIWIFPFLNVYAVFAKVESSTSIDISMNVPNGESQTEIMNLVTEAKFSGMTTGFGLTPTMGVGGGWIALDMNFTWTDIEALDRPAYAFVFGPRFGKNFKLKNPNRNINFWVGGFRVNLNSDTNGSLAFSDLFDVDQANSKIENGLIKVEEAQQTLETWYSGLSMAEQKLYQGVYDKANTRIQQVTTLLNAASIAADKIDSSTVQYALDKKQKNLWNFVVGSQFQINPSWMVRVEYGFLGTRNQFIGGLQYRFGL